MTCNYRLLTLIFILLSHSIHGVLPQEVKNRIQQLVNENPMQLSSSEYSKIAEIVLEKTPCNMLVFGVGNDSSLWIDLNKGGKTLFLENDQQWIHQIQAKNPTLACYYVSYDTRLEDWLELLQKHKRKKLYMDLPSDVMHTDWNIIFVDAPAGYSINTPGRMQSIFMAAVLAFKLGNTAVFVHDCDRVIEGVYSSIFLRDHYLKSVTEHLRYYLILDKSTSPFSLLPKD